MVISGAGFGLALSGELSRRKRHLEKLLQMTIPFEKEKYVMEIHLCTMPLSGAAGKPGWKVQRIFFKYSRNDADP